MSQHTESFKITNKGGSFVAALIMLYLMKPYFVWEGIFGSVQMISLITVFLGFLFFKNFDTATNSMSFLALFFGGIVFMYVTINGYNLKYSLTFFPLALLPFAKIEFQKNVYENFIHIFSILVSISLAVWVLTLIGIMPSLGIIAPLNSLKNYNYIVYPLLVRTVDSFRFFGPFDEPGVVGTVSGIILCIQNFNFKDIRTFIVLVSGLCSMSLFFYSLVAAYYLIYFIVEKRSTKNTIMYVMCIAIAMVIISRVPVLNEVLGERFEWNAQSGKFVGDNRSNEYARNYFEASIGTHDFWWGVSDKETYSDMVLGTSSYINTIMINGMIFLSLYLSLFILYAWKNKHTVGTFALFVFVLIATIYQRPFLFNAEYIFLWACLARNIKY